MARASALLASSSKKGGFVDPWMIYGAHGYTGRILVSEALRRGLRPILAGRNAQALAKLGQANELPCRVFELDNGEAAKHLAGVRWLLNCAGPFSATASPLLRACCSTQTHYLDVSGEISSLEATFQHDAAWKRAGIFVLPAIGFDVVPSDCLAALLKRQLPDANRLRLAIAARHVYPSVGSLRSGWEILSGGGRLRDAGRLQRIRLGEKTALIAFQAGHPELCACLPMAELTTAWHSTRIPHIETYFEVTGAQVRALKAAAALGPILRLPFVRKGVDRLLLKRRQGSSGSSLLESATTHIWGEVANAAGEAISLRLSTGDPYAFTVDAALTALQKLATTGIPSVGAFTPSMALGAEFVFELAGVEAEDMVPRRL